jgi:hypothetical protein
VVSSNGSALPVITLTPTDATPTRSCSGGRCGPRKSTDPLPIPLSSTLPIRMIPEAPKGMTVNRHFSTEAQDPFDAVTWTRRTAEIKNDKGKVIFVQPDCLFPDYFSQLAVNVVASKYFYGDKDAGFGSPAEGKRENSYGQLVGRVTKTIADWGKADGYFATPEDGERFYDELTALCLGQYAAFNSPVWFNVGLGQTYGVKGAANGYRWDQTLQAVVKCEDAALYPQGSACFIQGVADDLGDIMDLAKSEAMLFKGGSGTGSDLSSLRSTREKLTGGGTPSGPVSFLGVYDALAGVIKSGGKCLAPYQPVYTAGGVKTAKDLADADKDFTVLSYSKRLGRVAAKVARAWQSGEKPVVAVITDKGEFHVSADHPFLLKSGQVVRAIDLKKGLRLLAVTADEQTTGTDGTTYVRISLLDGKKGRMLLHRMVVNDRRQQLSRSEVVHHGERGRLDNDLDNLTVFASQAEHAAHHSGEQVGEGTHVFQTRRFSHAGASNGMHGASDFWQDEVRVGEYKKTQGSILKKSGRAAAMQSASRKVTMLNMGYDLINAGQDISTFASYIRARTAVGRRCPSAVGQQKYFDKHFGSYAGFYEELGRGNHEVVEIRPIGMMAVYSVEVDDSEDDDKRNWTEHNYVIAPIGTTTPFMNGVVCANTRSAARMNTLRCTHPDIREFVNCKGLEEKKAQALIAAGYDSNFNGVAYSSVKFQNTNLSVGMTDAFLAAVEANGPWTTKAVTDGRDIETFPANDLMDDIALATWSCGDPGSHYTDTINAMHTVPNSGRIKSSNPCCFTGDTLVRTIEGKIPIVCRYLRCFLLISNQASLS